jgi:hypothetical protein
MHTVNFATLMLLAVLRIRDVYPGSGMFIPDPDFLSFRIPGLGSQIQNQQNGRGKNLLSYLF